MPRKSRDLTRHPCGAINTVGFPDHWRPCPRMLGRCPVCGVLYIHNSYGRRRKYCSDRCRKQQRSEWNDLQ